ncbi:hypothetical protein [Mycolicibacterium boenickei]|uniref:hypothetical protein n=1 Tax=Mycolicibacterium boenickei TaxID=146017 RepID=UPI001F3DD745|nr:hypothetical protein [Mycolicibacterium boenickei]
MTEFRHGLMIGKFYPPRIGHHDAIRAAAARCDQFTVLVMAAAVETIPLADRMAWLREDHQCDANVRIAGIPCDAPVDVTDQRVWAAQVAAMRAIRRRRGVQRGRLCRRARPVVRCDCRADRTHRQQHRGTTRPRRALARVGPGHPGQVDHAGRRGGR